MEGEAPHSSVATSVVIVNYRTKQLTLAAARSALSEPGVRQVVVVDNASGDGSIEFLSARLPPSSTTLISAPSNLGFARANNLAIREATCELVLLLNSDATLVTGSVATLTSRLLSTGSIGLVAPAVFEADGTTPQADAFGSFPQLVASPFRRSGKNGREVIDWVSGVAMMIRKETFLAVGGFDEDFEMYLEDVDLCRRLRQLGKRVIRDDAAAVIHLGGQSWPSSIDKRKKYQRSKITYFRKCGVGPVGLGYLEILRIVRVSIAWCAIRLGRWRTATDEPSR